MSKLKITPGMEVRVEGLQVVDPDNERVAVFDHDASTWDEDHQRASLYAEAHNVANETGKSPRELMEQRDALIVAIKLAIADPKFSELSGLARNEMIRSLTSPK
jgi:hypothetical protein